MFATSVAAGVEPSPFRVLSLKGSLNCIKECGRTSRMSNTEANYKQQMCLASCAPGIANIIEGALTLKEQFEHELEKIRVQLTKNTKVTAEINESLLEFKKFDTGVEGNLSEMRAAIGNARRGVVFGIVTNNNDPDGFYRVEVKYPWILHDDNDENDYVTNWARVTTPMAGKDRGFWALPEVDDEVIVAFEEGDIEQPVVMGEPWDSDAKDPMNKIDEKLRVLEARIAALEGNTCTPDCSGNVCGPDGCGGICGECLSGDVCVRGQCEGCLAGEHEITSCEALGGQFNYETCDCEEACAFSSDCDYGFECAAGCIESECHEAQGTLPAKLCPDGLNCEYGDGVDLNHGNGYCVS
jgi:hypothetical protein